MLTGGTEKAKDQDDLGALPAPPEVPEEKKRCRACYSEMPLQANKCVACGSVQNLERFLTSSGAVLGLMVALVSVLTFAIPIWKAQFHSVRPIPNIALIEALDNDGISATFSNGGDAPMSAGLIILHIDDNSHISLPLSPSSAAFTIVKPNEITPVNLQVVYSIFTYVMKEVSDHYYGPDKLKEQSLSCHIDFATTDPSGSTRVETRSPSKTYCYHAVLILLVNWCGRTSDSDVCIVKRD